MEKKSVKRNGTRGILMLAATCMIALAGADLYGMPSADLQTDVSRQVSPGNISVSGRVLDQSKQPLAGARVRIKGTQQGTITDADGNYYLKRVPADAVLEFGFIGMIDREVKVSGRTVIDIILKEDQKQLSEVVVTGYQEIKKERVTGSVATINSSEFKNLDVKSMDQILKGAVSGVVAMTTGRPGQMASIKIRGANSLTGNTEPIWIIDGMPMQGEAPRATGTALQDMVFQNGIGNIPPDDIESITVLKDAAAAAIYGARAANGVIVVTTKRGKEGPTHFNITTHFGLSERPVNSLRMMNSEQKIGFERQLFADFNQESYRMGRVTDILYRINRGTLSSEAGEAQISELSKINTDWFRELYRPAFSTQINMSASGGGKRTRYYTAINYSDENGTEFNNNYKRFRFANKIDYILTPTLEIQADLSATYSQDRHTASGVSVLHYAFNANPYETPDGYDMSYIDNTYSEIAPGRPWERFNMKSEVMNNTAYSNRLEAQLNTRIKWKTPVKGLTATLQGTVNSSALKSRREILEDSYTNFAENWLWSLYPLGLSPDMARGALDEGAHNSGSYTVRGTLQYTKEWASGHFIDLMAGMEYSHSVGYDTSVSFPSFDKLHRVIGYPELTEDIAVKNINFRALGGTGRFESKLASLFFAATYSYLDKYVMSGSVRYDGSDVIGNENQYTPLWNISGRWNLHKEEFFKNEVINNLALKFGYGYTGSIDKNALPFVIMFYNENQLYDGQKIPTSFSYANPSIKWQTKQDMNIGGEIGLFNNRLNFAVNYYHNIVFDLLDFQRRPLSSGVSQIKANVANLLNRGLELDLSGTILEIGDFTWRAQVNLSLNHNEVTSTKFKSLSEIQVTRTQAPIDQIFVQGYPTSSLFGFKFAGIDPNTGHTLIYTKSGETMDLDSPRNAEEEQSVLEYDYLGDSYPSITGGLSTSLLWNKFILSMSMEYQGGHYIPSFSTNGSINPWNRSIEDQYIWRGPGDIAPFPAIAQYATGYTTHQLDRRLERGDYIRCTYLTLGYNLPSAALSKLGFESARISLTANNLFTITNYRGLDPALMGNNYGYPTSRKYSLSLNIGF